jgi:uncharacterized protein YjbJ (UPF0337 family)
MPRPTPGRPASDENSAPSFLVVQIGVAPACGPKIPHRFGDLPLGQQTRRPIVSLTDKITGKLKQAAGDIADDASLRRQGAKEKRKGEAKDELARSQERADRKAEEVANLERRTS